MVEEGKVSRRHPFSLFLGAIERIAYFKAARVIGTMPNLISHVRQRVRRAVPVHCIPFGFSPSEAPRETPKQNADIPKRITVGYAGSIGTTNALDTIIECIVRLRDDDRFRFVIAGDGDLRPALEARTKGCRNVMWLGLIPRSEVHGVLSDCDILYFAAHKSKVWEFGMSPNKITDYLLAARPIIGSYSGYPSILNEACCGVFVPSGDTVALKSALIKFVELTSAQRTEMGRKGRDWLFANRTWSRLADDYMLLLEAVIANQDAPIGQTFPAGTA